MPPRPTCLACKAEFATEEALAQHATAKLHWCCGPCGLGFPSRARLTRHEKTVPHMVRVTGAIVSVVKAVAEVVNEARFECGVCKRAFKSEGALEQHEADSREQHEAIQSLSCSLCKKVFKSAAAREQHDADSREKHAAMRREEEIAECGVCERAFQNAAALRQHEAHPGKTHGDTRVDGGWECSVCKRTFKSAAALRQHDVDSREKHQAIRGEEGLECVVCKRTFKSAAALEQHKTDSGKTHEAIRGEENPECVLCKRMFKTAAALEQHKAASSEQHEAIRRREAQQQQQQQEQARLAPSEAQQTQREEQPLQQHEDYQQAEVSDRPLQQLQPKKKKKKAKEFECEECGKRFVRDEDLSRHAQSLAHHPLSDLPCIAGLYEEARSASGAGCTARFTSPSAMLLHLESGSCSSGIDREALNAIIRKKDTDCVIRERWTVSDEDEDSDSEDDNDNGVKEEEDIAPALGRLRLGSRPATPARSESADSGGAILTPGSEVSVPSPLFSIPPVPTLRCPLCPGKRRKFPSMTALGQHMQSAAHTATEKIYHCPVTLLAEAVPPGAVRRLARRLRRERGRGFSTASGLAQHLESGACVGGEIALRVAMCYVDERLRQGDLPVSMLA